MDRLRTNLAKAVPADDVQRVIEAIEQTHVLTAKEPDPVRIIEHKGWTCRVMAYPEMWQVKAADGSRELVMNIEGHWTDAEVDTYAQEQIGLAMETVRRA